MFGITGEKKVFFLSFEYIQNGLFLFGLNIKSSKSRGGESRKRLDIQYQSNQILNNSKRKWKYMNVTYINNELKFLFKNSTLSIDWILNELYPIGWFSNIKSIGMEKSEEPVFVLIVI